MSSAASTTDVPPDETMGNVLLILTSVLFFFTITTTILRLWARYGRGMIGWDDYTIAVCCLLAIGRTIVQIVSVYHGNGRHRHYLSEPEYEYVNFLGWVTQIFLFLNIGLLKCSICILILRIKSSPVLRWCLYVMMGGLVLTNVECVIVLLAECDPVEKYWHPSAGGECWDTRVRIYSIYIQVGYSVVTDLICTLLPIVVLWNVQMKRSLKIAVCGLMAMGLMATATAVVRATSLGIVTTDLSWAYCIAAIWANTELHLGIIAANIALSSSIYCYFTGREHSFFVSSSSGGGHHRGYSGPGSFPTIGGGSGRYGVGSESGGGGGGGKRDRERERRKSNVGSESSQMELGAHAVVKTTEFRLDEEEAGEMDDGDMRSGVGGEHRRSNNVTRESWEMKRPGGKGYR